MSFEAFFELSPDSCVISGIDGYAKIINEQYVQATGYTREELLAVPVNIIVHPEDRTKIFRSNNPAGPTEQERLAIPEGKVTEFVARIITASGRALWMQWRSIRNGTSLYSIGRDVTETYRREEEYKSLLEVNRMLREKFRDLACVDALTNIGNARSCELTFSSELARARRQRAPLALAMLDIDHFKRVNDLHGHDVGNQVLKEVATTIRRTIRGEDHVFRWGGEEFVCLFPGVDLEEAKRACQRIQEALTTCAAIMPITVSIGISDGTSVVHEPFKAADVRMYEAKKTRNTICL